MATNLDDQLLNRNDQAGAAETSGSDSASAEPETQPTLREAVLAEKRRRTEQEKQAAKSGGAAGTGVAGVLASPLRKATSNLLKQAWLNLIDSFGLTLLWINIHAGLRMVIGDKFFCKLGEENTFGMSNLTERIALGILDFGCLLVLLIAGFIIRLIIGVMSLDPQVIQSFFSAIWAMLVSFVGLGK